MDTVDTECVSMNIHDAQYATPQRMAMTCVTKPQCFEHTDTQRERERNGMHCKHETVSIWTVSGAQHQHPSPAYRTAVDDGSVMVVP